MKVVISGAAMECYEKIGDEHEVENDAVNDSMVWKIMLLVT